MGSFQFFVDIVAADLARPVVAFEYGQTVDNYRFNAGFNFPHPATGGVHCNLVQPLSVTPAPLFVTFTGTALPSIYGGDPKTTSAMFTSQRYAGSDARSLVLRILAFVAAPRRTESALSTKESRLTPSAYMRHFAA